MNVRVLVGGLLVILDLAVIFLLGSQVAARTAVNWNLLLPTLAFNVFGLVILWVDGRDG